jgi:FMN-dependent NADH-azoreductase
MNSLLLVTSSLFGTASQTRQIAQEFVAAWRRTNPSARIVERDLTSGSIPHLSQETLTALATPARRRSATPSPSPTP